MNQYKKETQEFLESNTDERFELDLLEARKNINDNAVDDVILKRVTKIFKENYLITKLSWIQQKFINGKWWSRTGMIYFRPQSL